MHHMVHLLISNRNLVILKWLSFGGAQTSNSVPRQIAVEHFELCSRQSCGSSRTQYLIWDKYKCLNGLDLATEQPKIQNYYFN